MELQRIVLNMQISLTHSIARQAQACASKAAQAEAAYLRRVHGHTAPVPSTTKESLMSTHFVGEGNIGSAPDYREFQNGSDEPRWLLRLNVYFDNPIPKKDGDYEDRGGFWAPVELWHREAEHWKTLYQKGMRVLVEAAPCATSGGRRRERARHVQGRGPARGHPAVPHRVGGAQCRRSADSSSPIAAPEGGCSNRRTPAMHQRAIPRDSSKVVQGVPAALPKRRSCCANSRGLSAPLQQRTACQSQSGVRNRLVCCRHLLAPPC